MDTLNDTSWDLVIRGTGLEQSLVALALSRSDKKILHLDQNDYYGGSDAALSLQEAEAWVKLVNEETQPSNVRDAEVSLRKEEGGAPGTGQSGLSFSRAYSLSLSPQIIYTRSELLGCLVSSKVYRQLEFLALGSWWVYEAPTGSSEPPEKEATNEAGTKGGLKRVPSGREDIFADDTIDPRSKRSLMKFLKFVADYEEQGEQWESHASTPFSDFLTSQFGLSPELQKPLLAICMTLDTLEKTTTAQALPRIARHLRSIGMYGPGFGVVIAKWGGGAEIAQVACRAGAVGGAVYMLGNDIDSIDSEGDATEESGLFRARLRNGDGIKTRYIVESAIDAKPGETAPLSEQSPQAALLRSISVVSSPLTSLFPVVAEGAPQPAGAVVVFPPGSVPATTKRPEQANVPPVHVVVHSSETGECPAGQCVLYASVLSHPSTSHKSLATATELLLDSLNEATRPEILFTLQYTQTGPLPTPTPSPSPNEQSNNSTTNTKASQTSSDRIIRLAPPSLDLVFDDAMLYDVKAVWERVMHATDGRGDAEASSSSSLAPEFMVFDDRQETTEEDLGGGDD